MKTTTSLLCLALICGAAAPSSTSAPAAPAAADDDFESARRALRKQLADGLYEVGKWCHRKKYYQERDRMYGEAIEADPDHLKARKALGYRRNRDGSWSRNEEPVPERNHGRVDFEAIEAQSAEVLEEWRVAILALVELHADDLSQEQVEAEMKLVLARFPVDEQAHQRMGHVPGWEGRPWVTPEAKASHERRKQLKAIVEKRRAEGATVDETEPREFEQTLPWAASGQNARARALSTSGSNDVRVALEVAWAGQALMQEALGIEVELPEGLTFYLCENNDQLVAVARAHPAASAEGLETVGACWLDWRSMVTWGEDTSIRLDGVARQTVSWLLRDKYQLSPKQGWAWEGLGLYLSYQLCGTRLRFYVRETDYTGGAGEVSDSLRNPQANWLRMALDVLRKTPPQMTFLLGKDVNNLTERDLLVSYALGAYLVEARPKQVPAILARLAEEPPSTVLEEELGMTPDALRERVTEWLGMLE